MGFWQQAGKPDFARCAEFISRFDPELRESLNRSDMKALQWTIFYCWQQGEKPGGIGSYCTFALEKVGAAFRRSRWTVRRALGRLEDLGLISILHRRPLTPGNWQTNLYRMTDKLKAILSRVLRGSSPRSSGSKTAPQEFRKNTLMAGAPPSGCAASQDKDLPDGNERSDTEFRAWIERWWPNGVGCPASLRPDVVA